MTSFAPIKIESWLETFGPVADRIQNALRGVVEEVLGGRGRPKDLIDQFNLGGTMANRVHRAMEHNSAINVALLLPARPTMMRLIEQAERLCTNSPELAEELRSAYKDFHRQIARIASTHQELTAVLSVHDPRLLRETAERRRAASFRTMTDQVGGYTEVSSMVLIDQPNHGDPSRGDSISLNGLHGLRRLGVMQAIAVGTIARGPNQGASPKAIRRIDGQSIDPSNGTVIRELSSKELPALRAITTREAVYSIFAGDDLPHGTPVDLIVGSIMERSNQNFSTEESGTEQEYSGINTPTKLLLIDMLVHKDMWPGIEPKFCAYSTSSIPNSSYPGDFWFREVDYYSDLVHIDSTRLMEPINEAPKHSEMLRYAIEHTGIDLADFRIYRLAIRYPIVGHSYWMYFSRRPEEMSE